jgi:hypothetical protein
MSTPLSLASAKADDTRTARSSVKTYESLLLSETLRERQAQGIAVQPTKPLK